MKVTLCIPLFNAEKTIYKTLESLVNQDYPIYKLKIFDNVSTDNSIGICREFMQRFPFIELHLNESNIGAEANFTKCITSAEGDYTAVVHSDDIYEKNFISKSLEALEQNSKCVASFCGAYEMDSNELVTGERFLPSELNQKEITYLTRDHLLSLIFKYSNFITCPSVVVRSDVYREKIKNWNGSIYKSSADLDVWLRLSEIGQIACISLPLMKYRVADASYSYRIAKKRTTRHDMFLVLDQYKKDALVSDYNFLMLKDHAIRSLNIIRNKKLDECFPDEVKFDAFLILKKMCHSKWHFKMGIAIFGIHCLTRWKQQCKK